MPPMRWLVACLILAPAAGFSAVRAWQDTITLPTYAEDPPDVNPVFDALSPGHSWYPYASRTKLSTRRAPEEWRRLNLENEYLACTFLPDLGGHLYSCTDKLSGAPLFRANPSIKKALVGTRGAWVALGLELNFPVAHSRDAVSPVEFGTAQSGDRASVWVGKTDRVTGMSWSVEFVLRSGSAVLEQRVALRNEAAVRQPYSWWSNAAIDLHSDTRFVFATKLMTTHGTTDIEPWPIDAAGVEESIVANHKVAAGLFAYGCREPFMAVYHPGTRTGTVHVADPAVVAGKKLWTWGTDEDVKTRDWLSDDHSQGVEIQAGLFPNQETWQFLKPYETLHFVEYWMGARNLGGITRATVHAILNLERRQANGKAEGAIELEVTHAIPRAHIRVMQGGAAVLDERADLDPAEAFQRAVPNRNGGLYQVELADASGTVLLAHREGEYGAAGPSEVKLGPQPQRDWSQAKTEADYLARGDFDERASQFHFAAVDYRMGLLHFPGSVPLQKAAGLLAVVGKRYEEGMRRLNAVVQKLPGDMEVRFHLGVALARTGDEDGARKQWQAARNDAEWGAAAAMEIAASLARGRQTDAALEAAVEALRKRPGMPRAGRLRTALLRRAGKTEEARRTLEAWRAQAPLDLFLRVEQTRQPGADEGLWEELAGDPERVLDVADEYMSFGMYDDALPLLEREYPAVPANRTEAGMPLPQKYALIAYYRGYCREKMGRPAAADYRVAAALPLEYVFPHRASSFDVLRAALQANPSDASAHWLLGLLDMDGDMAEAAIEEWQKARSLRKGIPGLHLALAEALRTLHRDEAGAFAVLREGIGQEPQNQELLREYRAMQPAFAAWAAAGSGARPSRNPAPAPKGAVASGISAAPPPAGAITGGAPRELAKAALLEAAAGRMAQAQAVFTPQNFPEDRQPVEVRQAYLEVRLQVLRWVAYEHRCETVQQAVETIGDEETALAFTMYGFGPWTKTPRFQFYLGETSRPVATPGRRAGAGAKWRT